MVRGVRKVLPKDPEETLALDPDIWRPEEIDILSAGFPCQPFSVAGQQQGESDSRNLWPEVLRTLTYLRPPYAFFENVPGLLANEYFGTILRDLHEAGYDAEWGCFSAQEVGAPHKRERLFILAYRDTGQCVSEKEPIQARGIPEFKAIRMLSHNAIAKWDGNPIAPLYIQRMSINHIEAFKKVAEWADNTIGD
jgi:site-specific DNA-cytosine methylase